VARLGATLAATEDRARKFAWEIASDFSYPVIRAMELLLRRLWQRLYDGVEVHHANELAKVAPGKGLVYFPNHRSHVDYLLLLYFIHAQGLAPPHMAAGANLNFPVVGPLLRRGGAFFLRRSFKGEPLYAAVFREYLHAMLARGFPIAYFIEGGRGRSGRTLAPKGGPSLRPATPQDLARTARPIPRRCAVGGSALGPHARPLCAALRRWGSGWAARRAGRHWSQGLRRAAEVVGWLSAPRRRGIAWRRSPRQWRLNGRFRGARERRDLANSVEKLP
jgi:hypothetical protein